MIHRTVIMILLLLLCNFLSAQPGPLEVTPVQRIKLFEKNASIIDKLLDGSLKLAKSTNEPLQASDSYRQTLLELEDQIKKAAGHGDRSRVRELSGCLNNLMNRGFLPALGKARKRVSLGHPDEKQLFELRDVADWITNDLEKNIRDSMLASTDEATDIYQSLQSYRQTLKEKMTPGVEQQPHH